MFIKLRKTTVKMAETKTKSDKKVDTADHSNNMIYYVLIVISATGIISAAAVAGRKKH